MDFHERDLDLRTVTTLHRGVYVATGKDPTGKTKTWVSKTLPVNSEFLTDFDVYKVETTLKWEDFALGGGLFRTPGDWLGFAKRTGARPLQGKDLHGQLEMVICPSCSELNYPDRERCSKCEQGLRHEM